MPDVTPLANAELDIWKNRIVLAAFDKKRNGTTRRRALYLSIEQAAELAPRLNSCVGKALAAREAHTEATP